MSTSGRRFRVLIIDDEEHIRRLADRVLAEGGYETAVAPDANAALNVAASDEPIDLLLTDVVMPDVKGDELARRVRAMRPEVKVLYITGFADQLFAVRPVLWHDEAFIEKPFTIAGLREAVSLSLFGHTRGPD